MANLDQVPQPRGVVYDLGYRNWGAATRSVPSMC